jgi:hypothetical protein
MGKASLARAQAHSLDTTVSRFEELYGVGEAVDIPELERTAAD